MSILEKTIVLLNDLPENEIEVIYSFVQFLTSKQTAEKIVDMKTFSITSYVWPIS